MHRFSAGFHMVDFGPWPVTTALALWAVLTGAVGYIGGVLGSGYVSIIGLISLIMSMSAWFRDIRREGTYEGMHVARVQRGLRMGVVLFILSEAMLFFALFWGFFWSSLGASYAVGSVWPVYGTESVDGALAGLNTALLLSSGVAGTYGHHAFVSGSRSDALYGLIRCVILGLVFVGVQAVEYAWAGVWISSGVYGSVFYLLTGFHGGHVMLGLIMLLIAIVRIIRYEGTVQHLFGLELALWYWHFVDVVWLLLYVSLYLWGG